MNLFPKDRDLTRAPERVELRVDASAYGMRHAELEVRLDHFLARHLKWRSRSSIQELIRAGWVLVDASTPDRPEGSGEPRRETRPGRKLHHGSRVVIEIPPDLRSALPGATSDELAVLYEDEEVLAVDKPPMMPVHPSGRHLGDTLIQRVHARLRAEIEARGEAPRLCHRLDRETSGIVLVAKDPRAHARIMRQFERRRVDKSYLAIVEGVLAEPGGTIDYPLGPARASTIGLKIAISADGQPAHTEWRRVAVHADCTLVECRLHTGRQHQIRVHLAAIGHPIVGDKLYGPDEQYFQRAADGRLTEADLRALRLPRHALHNHRLVYTSPGSGERVEIVSPLPQDLVRHLEERESGSS
jgi:23S rRNA pseudouridine1911/1915/1917 synthase